MEKTMDIIAFVGGYDKCANGTAKDAYINRTLKVENYISYMRKMDEATKIVNASSYQVIIDEDGNAKRGNIRINSPIRFALTIMSMVDLYTNISIDVSKFLEEFDMLNRFGLVEKIMAKIPESENAEFNTIVSMTYDDLMTNENEIHRFIESQVQRVTDVLSFITKASEPVMAKLAEKISAMDEADIEKLGNKVNKIIDKVVK